MRENPRLHRLEPMRPCYGLGSENKRRHTSGWRSSPFRGTENASAAYPVRSCCCTKKEGKRMALGIKHF